jgi:hypothetical protein
MALFFPPALTLKNLVGGYNSNADFNTLEDNQTNEARNVKLTRVNTIVKRNGFVRKLDTALTNGGIREVVGGSGATIRGHYQLVKASSEMEIKKDIVAAGSNLWNYTSSWFSRTSLLEWHRCFSFTFKWGSGINWSDYWEIHS